MRHAASAWEYTLSSSGYVHVQTPVPRTELSDAVLSTHTIQSHCKHGIYITIHLIRLGKILPGRKLQRFGRSCPPLLFGRHQTPPVRFQSPYLPFGGLFFIYWVA